MSNYFKHPYCSNSALTALGQELGLLPEIGGDSYEAFRMGSLFDAVVTEPDKLDLIQMKILDTDYSFSKEDLASCKDMKASLERNKMYQAYMKLNPVFQKEVYRECFDFGGFKLNMRGKLDYFIPGMVADLKSTQCKTLKSFENSCIQFGYYRQMWLYCNLTGADRAVLLAVSKHKPHNVFVVNIKKGDERWVQGEKEIKLLAEKYYLTR